MTVSANPSSAIGLRPSTLVGLLRQRAQSEPDGPAYCFLLDGELEEERITYAELDGRARAIAAALQGLNAGGERALLLYPPGLDYVAAFFGCLYAGVLAVPAYPPRANRNTQRLQAIAADADARLALTTTGVLARMERSTAGMFGPDGMRFLATDRLAPGPDRQWTEPEAMSEEALAYLQYTSGSTSAPKGVMVSHGNVLHNSAYIHYGFEHTPESRSLCWLPHFHDMGLLDGIIQPLYGGFTGILMSSASFLQRPLRWLEAITRYRVTHSGGPNFAYDLCVRRISAEQRATLDLSSWRVAYNGAEPVRHETLERFADAFAPCGFSPSSFYPAYGLAEATLKVSGGRAGAGPILRTVRAGALEQNRVEEAQAGEGDARTLVGSGHTALLTEARIVHPETLALCAPDEVGEIWVAGPGVARGYWQNAEGTEHTFHAYLPETGEGPYLRTGDLGFVRDGELFVTGRLKDLIIIRGRNHYPQDIELTAERSHPSLRPGSGAAFSVELDGEEHLVVAQEVESRQQQQSEWQAVIAAIREAVAEEFEVQPAAVLLLKPGSIPKTSSGKVRRTDSRAKFLQSDWEVVAEWRAPRSLDAAQRAASVSFEPSSPASLLIWLQEKLAGMLGVSPAEIDCHRPLTHYGVDSLMAVELMHGIETRLGVALPLTDLLESPSLEQLAERAAAQSSAITDTKSVAFAPPELKRATSYAEDAWQPLSYNQQSLWFLHQVAPESTAYNIAFAARIPTPLDTEALRRAFQSLIERHASLRTSFAAIDGEPAQRVHEQAEPFFMLEDACDWSDAALHERMGLEARHHFDLEQAPLVRVFLFKRAAAEHVLMLVAHHIIVDFWSLSVLMRELGELYQAEVNGEQEAASNPQALRYTDYVNWQREFLKGAEGESHQRFWQQELAGELPVMDLALDYPRPAVQSHRGASTALRLGAALTRRLKSLAREHGATLYMTLLAAFDVLLYRHTGQREVLTGTPTSGRSSAQLADVVGYFVNPIVVRAELSGEMSFTELLARVRRKVLAAFAHQDYPFNLLVKQLQPERDPARSPLFQVMFALHRAHRTEEDALAAFALGEPGVEVSLCGLRLESMALEQRIAQFDLSLTMAEVDGELRASFEYCTDLFEATTIRRMADHFRVLLEAVTAEPSKAVDALSLLTDAEREQLLNEWNEAPRAFVSECVHEIFERRAAETPEHTAVIWSGGQVTYGELNARANRLARYLCARGVGPNVLVALCLERSVEMLVGVLGILKAGGAYLPLDPSYPRERLSFMLRDSGAACLVTRQSLLGSLPETGSKVICLDTDWPDAIAHESDADPQSVVCAENLAYVIYTSGSTGVPKGVMIGHGSLANFIEAVSRRYSITPGDRCLQFTSLSFDVSAEEIFYCLTQGATLVLRDDELSASTASLLSACREQKLTVLNLPTAYWHQLAASLTASDWLQADSVRLVITGGEKLQPERLSQWQSSVGPNVRLVDEYGPTEATISSTICEHNGIAGSARRVSIGRPIANAQAFILDARLQPLPVGVAGELHIGGLGLSQGYLNHPELTAEKFIPHPFSSALGARLYKTGDAARFLADGQIEFLGRLDDQVKVRGFRIELAEIERALVRHEHLREAVVVFREERGEKRLIAYLVADEAGKPAAQHLRLHLKERLPEYMLPSAFVFLKRLPLMPSGKVDRRALPASDPARMRPVSAFVAPQGEAEQVLAGIWADVLRLERVGVNDNFFELGGDSILTIQVIARARAAGLSLTARQMFTHPTVAELAAVAGGTRAAVEAEQGTLTGEVKLTPIQHWFFAQEFENPDHWNMAVMLEASRVLRPLYVEEALAHLVRHHDALRLRAEPSAAGWRAFITDDVRGQFGFRPVDLSSVGDAEQAEAIERVACETHPALSLPLGPLVRAVLFELGEGRAQRLLLVVHHLVVDAVSWGILLDDLSSLCDQLQRGDAMKLPSKTVSFKAWAQHLERYSASEAAQQGAGYWTALSMRDSKSLPLDFPGGANLEASTRTISVTLGEEETRSVLQDVPPVYHTQINDVLLTALVAACALWTGEDALLLELEGHGREELFEGVNLSRTVGWFTSAFPVLLKLDGPFVPGKALRSVKEQLRAIQGNGINYGVQRYLSGATEAEAVPRALLQPGISFNYLGQLDSILESATIFRLAREGAGPARDGRNHRTHLLEVNAGVYDRQLRLDWSYSSGLHDRATIEKLASDYLGALRAIIEHCLSPGAGGHTPSDFPPAELDQRSLDALLEALGPVADLYPLSPMQQGMLFHSLYSPETGMYVEQLSCLIEGELDEAAFETAWQHVAHRHAALRTSFIWENLEKPLQVVRPSVTLELSRYDLRGLSNTEQDERLNAFLNEDRLRAFDLGSAPLVRLALLRATDDSYHFVWTHHHLLLDGWSAALLLREVFALYDALCRGEELVATKARSFRDYIVWLQKQDASKAELFWRAELKGFTAPTPLVIGWPGGDEDSAQQPDVKQQLRLTPEETARLQAFVREHQLTLSTLVHGAFALLLSRYSMKDDLVFGTTVSGRPPALAGVDSIAGLFINTLPVRVRVTPESSALSWLRSLQDKLVALRDYEYSSLAEIQKSSDITRGTSLFESLLVFENYPVDEALLGQDRPLKLSDVRSFELTNYPLTVVALPGTELSLQALSKRDRFDAATIERLLGHLKTLLLEIAASPGESVARVPLLDEDERRRILREWNETARAVKLESSISQLFEEQAASRPDATAVVYGEQRLSFRELNRRANQVAHHLRRLGVGPEVLVGLCLERSPEMIVGLVGILKAGGAYLPLDPSYPRERLAFMVQDTGLPVLLTQQSLAGLFAGQEPQVVCLDTDWEMIAREAEDNPANAVAPDNLAYIIYTSGSTGRPKGVAISQASVLNMIGWYQRTFALTPSDRSTHLAGVGFDGSVMELWAHLTAGVGLYLPDQETRLSAVRLRDWLIAHEITISFAPTPVAEMLLDLDWPEATRLRVLTTGGDKLHHFPKASLGFGVVNLYGPTENTIISTTEMVRPEDGARLHSPPIGRPLDNVEVYLLDEQLRPMPVGVPGELYVGGLGLARGYWGRPDLTAERFVPHPFSAVAGARLYRTGDLAHYLPDGRLEFLGRIDHQVKLRGYRIELGEIETLLSAHETVGSSVVVVREDVPGEKRLVAYLVATDEDRLISISELRGYLRERLPEYMVPSAFVILEALPLTPNGKIDRRALPVPGEQPPSETFVAPRSPLEEALCDIWREVLGVERVGVDDNFFELGGHSLMATRVLSNVRRIFRVDLPLRILFEAHTISELARAIIPFETQPGQTEKIARVLLKIKSIPAEELEKELQRKRRERGKG
ncbi:MAG TPA: amino acid adenylation domain-containing protein [Pyrinomonadaceae bacterium]